MFIRQDEIRPDDRYYWVTENENGSFSKTPKALEDNTETAEDGKTYTTKGLKSNHIAQVKQTANSILAQTDWMVIRKAERNVDIPADTASYRAAVIAKATELEAAISAVTSVEELIAVNLSFPNNGVI
jgi:hypothetical protein